MTAGRLLVVLDCVRRASDRQARAGRRAAVDAARDAELRGHGIASVLYCGWATPAGIELARRYGTEPEVWGEGGNLQWVPEPRFAAWLDPRLAAADLVHAHMFGAWWAAGRAAPTGIPLVVSEHNQYLWPDRPRSAEMREALGRVDVFFAHGPSARATVIAHGLPLERVRRGSLPSWNSGPRCPWPAQSPDRVRGSPGSRQGP